MGVAFPSRNNQRSDGLGQHTAPKEGMGEIR